MAFPAMFGWSTPRIDQWSDQSPLANFLFVLVSETLTVGALYWFVRYRKHSFAQTIALRWPRWRDAVYAIGGILTYFVLFLAVYSVVNAVIPIDAQQQQALGFSKSATGIGLVLAFVGLVILPPLAEETMFRGFLYGTFRRHKLPVPWSIVLTSVLFGGLHLFGSEDGGLLWIAFLDTFVLSVVLCYVREKTGSIWASIAIHALKNGFVFVNLFIIHAT